MQTFLPESDIEKSINCLDKQRLWKQVLEAKTLLQGGWPNHPCSKMWNGYKDCLGFYLNTALYRWKKLGANFSVVPVEHEYDFIYPTWFGMEEFHNSHKSKLLFKGECQEVRRIIQQKYSIKIDNFCEDNKYPKYKQWTFEDLQKIKKDEFIIDIQIKNYYRNFGWTVPLDLNYVWPSN